MVGDRESDIQVGIKSGMKTVYISEKNEKIADYVCRNVLEFVQSYLED